MNWRYLRQGFNYTLIVVACLGGIAIALPRQQPIPVSCKNGDCNSSKLTHSSTSLSVEQLQRKAKAITVKVLSKELLGSGTLVKREGQIYTVVTNAHVLRAANPPYQIETLDGRIYTTVLVKAVELQDNDIAILQFRSTKAVYAIATVGDSSNVTVGDRVFVGGFTAKVVNNTENQKHLALRSSPQAEREAKTGFMFTTGQVTLLLDKPLEGGYQIGYTNDIRKGMSGAPLLNHQGEVIGINGLHKDPLWDAPELYIDGSEPTKPLQDLITRSSLAVPIKTLVKLVPQVIIPNTLSL